MNAPITTPTLTINAVLSRIRNKNTYPAFEARFIKIELISPFVMLMGILVFRPTAFTKIKGTIGVLRTGFAGPMLL